MNKYFKGLNRKQSGPEDPFYKIVRLYKKKFPTEDTQQVDFLYRHYVKGSTAKEMAKDWWNKGRGSQAYGRLANIYSRFRVRFRAIELEEYEYREVGNTIKRIEADLEILKKKLYKIGEMEL